VRAPPEWWCGRLLPAIRSRYQIRVGSGRAACLRAITCAMALTMCPSQGRMCATGGSCIRTVARRPPGLCSRLRAACSHGTSEPILAHRNRRPRLCDSLRDRRFVSELPWAAVRAGTRTGVRGLAPRPPPLLSSSFGRLTHGRGISHTRIVFNGRRLCGRGRWLGWGLPGLAISRTWQHTLFLQVLLHALRALPFGVVGQPLRQRARRLVLRATRPRTGSPTTTTC